MSAINVVAHNMQAMFSNRQLGITNIDKAKTTEKLASGYRINRAADDAAGLSISEKMRKQIRGLKQGSDNLKDGVSFCQTADGYLEEVVDMLHRMNELSIKASNGTNSASDRSDIDNEIQELKKETKKIFKTAKFNETIIFDMPYIPAPEIDTEYSSGKTVLRQISSSFPPGATLDAATQSSGHMTNTFTKNGITYNSASYIDFSGVNFNDIALLDGTGFFSTCCTCDNKYCLTFNSATAANSVSGSGNYTYTVGTAGVRSASELVQRIVDATGGNPQHHFSNYEVDPSNANRLVVYDNRPEQRAGGDYGLLSAGVVEEFTYKDQGDEIQVFSDGLDSSGNVKYGGIELNDVRHTWDELGITISPDGKTFASSQVAKFHDYTGEYLELHVNEGDPLSQVTRRNYWSADQTGIYVNDVFAETWQNMGIKATSNYGEHNFLYKQQMIYFEVNDGDNLQDVIDGVNGKVLNTRCSWDLIASGITNSTALSLFDVSTVLVTEENKNALDASFSIATYTGADESNSGITINSSDGAAYTNKNWENFQNETGVGTPEYEAFPISDWGLTDRDGNSLDSSLITFDDTAQYTYINTELTSDGGTLPISFSFKLADEAGLDEAIAALDGVVLNKTFSAPNSMSVTSSTGIDSTIDPHRTSYMSPSVRLSLSSLSYDEQKAYERDFNDANATLSGTVIRTLIDPHDLIDTTINDNQGRAGGATNENINYQDLGEVYLKVGDLYYKKQKMSKTYDIYDNWKKTTIDTYQNAYYKYNGSFANVSVNSTGDTFNYTKTTVETYKQKMAEAEEFTYSQTTDTRGYTWDEIQNDILNNGWSYENSRAASTRTNVTEASSVTDTKISYDSKAFDTVDVPSALSGGSGFDIYTGDRVNSFGDATINLGFQAHGYAYCAFGGRANSYASGNKNASVQLGELRLNIPPRELDLQASSENTDYITLRWSGMNNAIIGIQNTNTRTIASARKAIDQVGRAIKYVSDERSKFGAQQNRVEHAIKINDNTGENTTAAESLIRDADMSEEMVKLSRFNIMQQAGQAMLSQANQANQGVLSLLQ